MTTEALASDEVEARELVFDRKNTGVDYFAVIYVGWYSAYSTHARGADGVILCNSIGRKLRLISKPEHPEFPKLEIRARLLRDEKDIFTILLTEGEHSKLQAMIEDPTEDVQRWHPDSGEKIEAAMKWIKTAPKVKVSQKSLEH